MAAIEVCKGIHSVGVLNPNMRVFDVVMKTEYGTSYNSYLVEGDHKKALIETVHHRYFNQYIQNIEQVCPLNEIDYVILNHNEPDHSGSLAMLMEKIPNATVVLSQAGSVYIKNITNRTDLKVQVAKSGDVIDLGGKTLSFVSAPFLHWPDSMFTYVKEDKLVFTCDFLGSHYCEPTMHDQEITYLEKYKFAFKGYYDAIFGPFKPYVIAGLEKLDALDADIVCPSHGPILTKGGLLGYTKEMYKAWSTPAEHSEKVIPLFYCTAYGNTEQVAAAIRDGILEVLPGAKCELYDLIDHDLGEMGALLNSSDAFCIGTPTINRDAVPPVMMLLAHVDVINNQKKPVLPFGSYGWSGEGVPNVVARLNSQKFKVFGEGFKVIFVPSKEDLEKAKELGREFAKSLS